MMMFAFSYREGGRSEYTGKPYKRVGACIWADDWADAEDKLEPMEPQDIQVWGPVWKWVHPYAKPENWK